MDKSIVEGNDTLSKLGNILIERGLTQAQFIRLVKDKTDITFSKSRMSQYIHKKNNFMTSETLKIIAYCLEELIDNIVDDWEPIVTNKKE